MARTAYLLVGPTAVGKTAVAQQVAEAWGMPVLSTDSMQVYRGMDIGTAKPTLAERGCVTYYGMDFVEPDTRFSTGDYLRAVSASVPQDQPVLATGGTGLYLKALAWGLEDMPDADPALRAELEQLTVSALQEALRIRDADWLAELPDPENPRRLVRAIELAEAGVQRPQKHHAQPRLSLVGLTMERAILHQRIQARVDEMFANGLLEEVEALLARFPQWSSTAAQAIGYAEAIQVLRNELDRDAAREKIVIRTRQYAKRQMTWFNNQFDVTWIEMGPDAVDQVRRYWEKTGGVELAGLWS